MRSNQLILIENDVALSGADFRIDERTRDLGRKGIAEARAALAAVRKAA